MGEAGSLLASVNQHGLYERRVALEPLGLSPTKDEGFARDGLPASASMRWRYQQRGVED